MRQLSFLSVVTVGLVICCAAESSRADEDISPEARKQIAGLEAQVKALQAQITLLKKELDDAKATIKFLAESQNRPAASVPDEPAGAQPPVSKKPMRPTISAPVDLLRDMPAELRPKPNVGWDKFVIPKVEAWAKEQKPDAELDARFELIEVHVTRANDSEKLHWKTSKDWRVSFTFALRDVPFGTVTMDQVFGNLNATNSIRFYWDEAMARRAEKLKIGSMVRLRGTVNRMELDCRSTTPTRAKLSVWLINAALPEIEP